MDSGLSGDKGLDEIDQEYVFDVFRDDVIRIRRVQDTYNKLQKIIWLDVAELGGTAVGHMPIGGSKWPCPDYYGCSDYHIQAHYITKDSFSPSSVFNDLHYG